MPYENKRTRASMGVNPLFANWFLAIQNGNQMRTTEKTQARSWMRVSVEETRNWLGRQSGQTRPSSGSGHALRLTGCRAVGILKDSSERLCGFLIGLWNEMRVHVKGCARIPVAEPSGDGTYIDTRGKKARRHVVP